MRFDPNTHHRRSLRLKGYDYSQGGAYFVTICTRQRKAFFGDVVGGEMRLNSAGQVIEKYWEGLPDRFPGVSIDARAFMPNHIHGIVILVGAQFIAPSDDDLLEGRKNKGAMNRAPTLGEIVRSFKASTTRQLRLTQLPEFGWQRNYLEHVIRDDDSLNRIREYIGTNALRWDMDRENPYRLGEDPFDRWLASFTEGPDKRWRM